MVGCSLAVATGHLIDLRRMADPSAPSRRQLARWPASVALRQPEAILLKIVHLLRTMEDDGWGEDQALARIDSCLRRGKPSEDLTALVPYVRTVLSLDHPDWSAGGWALVPEMVRWADTWVAGLPMHDAAWPPLAWRQECLGRIGPRGGLEPSPGASSALRAALTALECLRRTEPWPEPKQAIDVRARPGDHLWRFASPAQTWLELAGREGVFLVRDGMVIAHIVTAMN